LSTFCIAYYIEIILTLVEIILFNQANYSRFDLIQGEKMYSEPGFFEANQENYRQTAHALQVDTSQTESAGMIPYDQINRDIHLESTSGGRQNEPAWQNPMQPASYW
jgi:hypothetical protein